MRFDSITKNHLVIASVVALISLSGSTRAIAAWEDSQQLTQRFGEAANEAAELARDADEAESLVRSRANWEFMPLCLIVS